MAASPFAFFRGAAALMAADVGPLPTSGLQAQLCGDAHLLNLGAFAAPDGHLVFDLNDFDETCRGPFEWDVKRLAASAAVAGRVAGVKEARCADAVRGMAEAYRAALQRFAAMPALELARLEITPRDGVRPLQAVFRRAARNTPSQLLEKVTCAGGGGYARFCSRPPLLVPLSARAAPPVLASLAPYRETLGPGRRQVLDAYAPRDVAFKVVGTGSIGVEDDLVLLFGNGPEDPLFLQIKQADATCWRPYLRARIPYRKLHPHDGRRVAEGQLRTQTVSDPFLGWTRIGPRQFLVRQWSDHKASLDPQLLTSSALGPYAALCGELLAKAHARTGDPVALLGYLGRGDAFDRAMARFASAYADQTEEDHAGLCRAIRAGGLRARSL